MQPILQLEIITSNKAKNKPEIFPKSTNKKANYRMPRKPVPPCSLAIAAWAEAPAVSARSRRRAGTTPAPRTPRSGTPPRPSAAAVSTEPPPSHSYPINQTAQHHHQTKPKKIKKKVHKIHNSNNTEKCRQFEAQAKSGSERWQLWELGDEGDGERALDSLLWIKSVGRVVCCGSRGRTYHVFELGWG